MIKQYFKDIEITLPTLQNSFIQGAVENRCHDLHYNLGRVRRVVPFNFDKFKKMRPICIERFYSSYSIQDIRDVLQEHVFTLNRVADGK